MITICPHCNQEFPETPDEYLGMTLECPSCHQNFVCEKPRFCTNCETFSPADAPRCRQCGKLFLTIPPTTSDSHTSAGSSGDFRPADENDSADRLSFRDKLALKYARWKKSSPPVHASSGTQNFSENASSDLADSDDKDCFREEVDLFTSWRKFADFRGRSSRKELALHIVTAFTLYYFLAIEFPPLQRPVIWGSAFLVAIPLFVRRLHDVGLSGWWFFLAFPINCLFAGLPALLVSSQPGRNKWGLNPVGVSSRPERNHSRDMTDGLTVLLVLAGLVCLGGYIGLHQEELNRQIDMLMSTNAYRYQTQTLQKLEQLELKLGQVGQTVNDNIKQVNNNIGQVNDNIGQVKWTIGQVNNNVSMLTTPNAYEYKWFSFDRDEYKSFNSDLNALASNGWEYVGVLTADGINCRLVLFRRKRNR